ncbi:unnamed protein product [Nyctereutes procyonoides]|uniref:(raccoon dog) hypothetical protein n=1 Tax=Nyctereutes procyonoides TaxID=34880 RepID=A0A811YAF5_NYCPR|nr:unnamed protein product [Nyctereutes procyonoides]
MLNIGCHIIQHQDTNFKLMTKGVEPLICTDWIRHKFTKSRIPDKVFQPSPADHKKYGGDPQHPHKLHIVTRIKTHPPQVRKNIPSVNAKLKVLPQGLPTEEDVSNTCLKSTGELVVRWHLNPVDQEAVKS